MNDLWPIPSNITGHRIIDTNESCREDLSFQSMYDERVDKWYTNLGGGNMKTIVYMKNGKIYVLHDAFAGTQEQFNSRLDGMFVKAAATERKLLVQQAVDELTAITL